jgi:hypothetical protein
VEKISPKKSGNFLETKGYLMIIFFDILRVDVHSLGLGSETPQGRPFKEAFLEKRGKKACNGLIASGKTFKQWKTRYFALYDYRNGPAPAIYYFLSRFVCVDISQKSAADLLIGFCSWSCDGYY